MKNPFYLIVIFAILLFSSCKKEAIPEPNAIPPLANAPSLWVSGTFNNVPELKVVDGENYEAECLMQPGNVGPPFPGAWTFVLNPNSAGVEDTMKITFLNHQLNFSADLFSDLLTTTSVDSLEMFNGASMNPLNKVVVDYAKPPYFYTTFAVPNSPLAITERKDTVVDGTTFLILRLEGDLSLADPMNNVTLDILDFEARIALTSK